MYVVPPPRLLTPEEFPILPWGWTDPDPEQLDLIRRCGFNLAGFLAPQDLDLAQAAGLKAIVFDRDTHVSDETISMDEAEITRRVRALAARVKDHPALFAYFLRDEPGMRAFASLALWGKILKEADPKALIYSNLFPNFSLPSLMHTDNYDEYVDQFVAQVRPPFLSLDHYSVLEDGSYRTTYFPNLEKIHSAANQAGIPFWHILLSNAHFDYAEPSPATLRFQVYTSMCYGVRGISYFTYFTPDVGNYRLAPIDETGKTTPTWEMLRLMNLQIHRLGPIYLPLEHRNVFHTGDVPEGSVGIDSSLYLDAIGGGGELVVGEFAAADGRPHVLITNKSLRHSLLVELKFKQKGRILRASAISGSVLPTWHEDFWLAPGQGTLFILDPE